MLKAGAVLADDAVKRNGLLRLVAHPLHIRIDYLLRTEIGLRHAAEQIELVAERVTAVAVSVKHI